MSDYMLYFILCASIALNVFFIWYIKNLLSQLYFVASNLSGLVDETISFRDHLSSVYELEMFYGDETLAGLLTHVGQYSEMLSDFEEIYALDDEEELKENDDDEYESEGTEDTAGAQKEA
jgi:hypothetical protein|tara:strand:- start:199 stop:558 length:360 start_codon:yes stop_codon:yes gene_type:complete